ncbi:MAG: site-2 protease family protein [Candidatus Dormibacteria bacterium]|jgi:regulator of sigma E protease
MSGIGGVLIAIVAFLVVITVVVVIHELGHFVVAKRSGIRVDGFSIFVGPPVLKVQRGETVYALRAIPVGGFVRMAGMLGIEGEADAGERNFYRASIPRRLATILAGIAVNFVFGGICLTVVAAQPIPSNVPVGEPTARAGLVSGDVILSVGGQTISYASTAVTDADFYAAVQRSEGRPITVVYRASDGADHAATITPELVVYTFGQPSTFPSQWAKSALVVTSVDGHGPGTGDPATILGGGPTTTLGFIPGSADQLLGDGTVTVSGFVEGDSNDRFTNLELSDVRDGNGSQTAYATAAWRIGYGAQVPGEALIPALHDGFGAVPAYAVGLVQLVGQLFVHPSQASSDVAGPVGIASLAGATIQQGWVQFLSLVGLISLAVGFMNLLPIPGLDGGWLLLIIIEAVRRRRVDPQRQLLATGIGWAFIILLVVLITFSDISHLSGGAH